MSISQNFPSSRPSLNLNFARSKKLDPRITFTRTSTATYVDEDGLVKIAATDTPRFEHNPSTGESLGLLIEESRTNLVTYSEQFNDASWTKSRSSVSANSIASPDGTTTADTLTEDTTASNTHSVFKSFSATSGTTYTLSVFFKSKERTNIVLAFDGGAGFNHLAAFSSSTGTVGTTFGSPSATSITAYPNGWYRCSMSAAATSTATANALILLSTDNTFGGRVYTGDGTSGIYIWGAQLEAGAFPTSYIPTVASTVTRSADSVSITGANFSGFYNPDEGSVCAKFKFYANHGSYSEAVSIAGAGSGFMVIDAAGGLVTDCYSANTVVTGGNNARNTFVTGVRAYKFSTNDSVIGCSGASSITTQTGTKVNPNPTVMWIGRRGTGAASPFMLNGYIQSILYYPVRLSNTLLQTLTK